MAPACCVVLRSPIKKKKKSHFPLSAIYLGICFILRTQSWQVPSTRCGTEVLPKFSLESGEAETLSNSSITAEHCATQTTVAAASRKVFFVISTIKVSPVGTLGRNPAPGPLWSTALPSWGLLPHGGGTDEAPRQDTDELCTHCVLGVKGAMSRQGLF